ncbi:MAG: TetR/AcrR family transcriptional regulator [Phycisphaerales bacterium]|nr:TetR/AcrR family transcriptional regulator [Phycisphaerae bacterium]NNF43776.1 TetR/AcrR family transcriptional regulator [Phycisphaerales bacterium]NNM27776.1 TetR/AcrR family transcriptional regulator [Phycisphaerales bacterium]
MARMRAPERREQLLEVAAGLFAERGYHGTTTAELAAAAGVTEPILYRHFESKRVLFETLIEAVGAEVIAAWQQRLDGIDDPATRLRTLLDGNPATHDRGRRIYRVIFQAMSEREEKGVVRAIRRHLVRLHRFLAGELEGLQSAGVVRDDETAAALAWLLIDVAIGYGMVTPLRGTAAMSSHGKGRMQRVLAQMLTV